MSELILYTTEDGSGKIQLRAQGDTAWLTQLEMAELFNATKQNIALHLKNIFAGGELTPEAVVKESLTTASDGKAYRTKLYRPASFILALINAAKRKRRWRPTKPMKQSSRRWKIRSNIAQSISNLATHDAP